MAQFFKCEREPDSLDILEQIIEQEGRAGRRENLWGDEQKRWFLGAVILVSTTTLIVLIWRLWRG
jgi:hypothetical protein